MIEDPISFAAGDTNPTRYVGNGSVNGTDPSGLESWFQWAKRGTWQYVGGVGKTAYGYFVNGPVNVGAGLVHSAQRGQKLQMSYWQQRVVTRGAANLWKNSFNPIAAYGDTLSNVGHELAGEASELYGQERALYELATSREAQAEAARQLGEKASTLEGQVELSFYIALLISGRLSRVPAIRGRVSGIAGKLRWPLGGNTAAVSEGGIFEAELIGKQAVCENGLAGEVGAPTRSVSQHGTPFQPLTKSQRTALKAKLDARTITQQEFKHLEWDRRFANRRASGVRRFWAAERARLRAGEPGARAWTPEQAEAILAGRKPQFNGETLEGHHLHNALDHPHVANEPWNIYPATRTEHFQRWHGGNWQNDTFGRPLNPLFLEEF